MESLAIMDINTVAVSTCIYFIDTCVLREKSFNEKTEKDFENGMGQLNYQNHILSLLRVNKQHFIHNHSAILKTKTHRLLGFCNCTTFWYLI